MVTEIPMPGGPKGCSRKSWRRAGRRPRCSGFACVRPTTSSASRRVLRLLYANWLPQIDKPADQRASIAIRKPTLIYAAGLRRSASLACGCSGRPRQGDRSNLARPAVFSSVYWSEAQGGTSVVGLGVGGRRQPGAGTATTLRIDRQAGRGALSTRAREASRQCRIASQWVPQGIAGRGQAGRTNSGGN